MKRKVGGKTIILNCQIPPAYNHKSIDRNKYSKQNVIFLGFIQSMHGLTSLENYGHGSIEDEIS